MHRCCPAPELLRAWVPCRPFRAVYCDNCHDVTLTTGPVLTFLFEHIFRHFWFGAVRVELP